MEPNCVILVINLGKFHSVFSGLIVDRKRPSFEMPPAIRFSKHVAFIEPPRG